MGESPRLPPLFYTPFDTSVKEPTSNAFSFSSLSAHTHTHSHSHTHPPSPLAPQSFMTSTHPSAIAACHKQRSLQAATPPHTHTHTHTHTDTHKTTHKQHMR